MANTRENNINSPLPGELDEFEVGSSTALTEFESGGSTQLDNFEDPPSGMLDEFENPVNIGLLDEKDEADEPEIDDESLDEEITDDDDELIGDESEFIEPVDDEDLITEIDDEVPEPEIAKQPENPVIAFVCEHAFDTSDITDSDNWMLPHRKVKVIKLPCAGMMKTEWIIESIHRGVSGVMVISCPVENCYHRSGARTMHNRLANRFENNPCVRIITNYRAARIEILDSIKTFVNELGAMEESCEIDDETQNEPDVIYNGELM